MGIVDGRAVVASYGRAVDVAMWRTPRMHVFALDEELRATEVVAAPESEGATECVIGAGGDQHVWFGSADVRGSRSSRVIFEDLSDGRRYRVNLKSKRLDFTPLEDSHAACFAVQGSTYWQGDGSSAVNAYEIVR